jgi:hypothetical protein
MPVLLGLSVLVRTRTERMAMRRRFISGSPLIRQGKKGDAPLAAVPAHLYRRLRRREEDTMERERPALATTPLNTHLSVERVRYRVEGGCARYAHVVAKPSVPVGDGRGCVGTPDGEAAAAQATSLIAAHPHGLNEGILNRRPGDSDDLAIGACAPVVAGWVDPRWERLRGETREASNAMQGDCGRRRGAEGVERCIGVAGAPRVADLERGDEVQVDGLRARAPDPGEMPGIGNLDEVALWEALEVCLDISGWD